MAIKALMLRKKIDLKKKEQEALRVRGEELATREADLTRAIDEVETEEEQGAVEESIGEFEREKAEHEQKTAELDAQVRELEKELADLEEAQSTEPAKENIEREDNKPMEKRTFDVAPYIEREDVQAFLTETRTAMREKRALTNVGLTVPVSLLGLLRENIINYSKLYKHVAVKKINGEGRLVIMSTIPEAVWTDCCANLNEMSLTFYGQEFDCWRVGGYYAVCNASLEDSDIELASEIMVALAQGIGLALDKAILYGTGTRMPLGIVTRLAQTSQPGDYPSVARPWVDLHTSNIKAIASSVTGQALFAAITNNMANASSKYSRGEKVFTMNEKTYAAIVGNSIVNTADGRIVGAVNGTMPVTGGIIEVLGFIPDNVVIGGYFDCYTLAERAGQKFATSEHVRFLQDQTVFRGTARYDGGPSIAEAFVAFGINNTTPNATMTFAADDANNPSA